MNIYPCRHSKRRLTLCRAVVWAVLLQPALLFAQPANDDGFRSIFNGKNLDGWKADPEIWKVENGVIVGNPTDGSSKLTWTAGELDDFSLRFKLKISDGVDLFRFAVNGNEVAFDFGAEKVIKTGAWVPVELDARGRVLAKDSSEFALQTTKQNVFAGGDMVLGSDLVVTAIDQGRKAALGILDFVMTDA